MSAFTVKQTEIRATFGYGSKKKRISGRCSVPFGKLKLAYISLIHDSFYSDETFCTMLATSTDKQHPIYMDILNIPVNELQKDGMATLSHFNI